MLKEREERQDRFRRLFQAVVSELEEGNDEKFMTLKKGDETALRELASGYELSQDELVFACDAGIAGAGMVAESLKARWG